jgi:pimeloyl-ACP methyl ester carboxylesterase
MTATFDDASTGSGPTLFFMHGFACAKEDWDAVTAELQPRHRVDAYDFPGHGAAGVVSGALPASQWTIESYATDAIERVKAAAANSVVLIGHSLGCRVALEMAARIPDRIGGLVLIEPSMAGTGTVASAEQRIHSSIAQLGFERFVETRFSEMFLEKNERSQAILARAKRIDPLGGAALFASQAGWDAGCMAARLTKTAPPVLMIQSMYFDAGGNRRAVSEGCDSPWLNFVASVAPQVRIELLTGSGHFPHIEQPHKIAGLIEQFIEANGLT